jgi:hypothetical protein
MLTCLCTYAGDLSTDPKLFAYNIPIPTLAAFARVVICPKVYHQLAANLVCNLGVPNDNARARSTLDI